jgi:hypothetical protein
MKFPLFILISILATSCSNLSNQKELEDKVSLIKNQNQQLINKNDSLLRVLNSINKKPENYWFKASHEGEKYIMLGIQNPEHYVDSVLHSRPDKIPLEAILGGTMSFGKVELLSSKWLISEYDDGHIMGRTLFEYQISEDGQVDFKPIRTIEDE